ncbi:MAG: type II secretion system F family protein [Campylobacterota bacterium]
MVKVDAYPMLKTVVFSLHNGRSLTASLQLLAQNTHKKKEKNAYNKIEAALKQGQSFSCALQRYCICSKEVIYFVSMAEKGLDFTKALDKVVYYIETKESFKQESSDKLTMPTIYFFLSVIVIGAVNFIALPMQFERADEYSNEVQMLIQNHLLFAKILSNVLVILLAIVAFYFFVTILAMFSRDRLLQGISNSVVQYLPGAKKIVLQFEKFIVFMMISQMLYSGIGFKKALEAIVQSGDSKLFQKGFSSMLEGIKTDGKLIYPTSIFDLHEISLLQGVGSNEQMGQTFLSAAKRCKYAAMNQSKKFFRYITLSAVFLMAFAVFIEFYVVVLTQVILQKGLMDMGNSGALF